MTPVRLVISAAEASADRLGGAVLDALRSSRPVAASGMGGPRLRSAGLQAWHDASELSVVGMVEVAAELPRLWRLCRSMVRRAIAWRPDVAVLIDAPDFHLRMARSLRRAGIPVILFVPPAVWASRPGRVRRYAAAVDRMMVLFPFEMAAWKGVPVDCVGHPLVDQIPAPRRPPDLDRAPIALLPGSRRGELARHLPVLKRAAEVLDDREPGRGFVVPVADPGLRDRIFRELDPVRPTLVDGPDAVSVAVGQSAGALVASGTATLETALLGCPQVVYYRLHPLTYAVARRLKIVPHWALPNVLLAERAVAEHIQDAATGSQLAHALVEAMARPDDALRLAGRVRPRLGPPGAAQRAAARIAAFVDHREAA